MTNVIPFTYKNSAAELLRTSQQLDVKHQLMAVLDQLDARQVRGLLFLVDLGDGEHEFGFSGSYEQNPEAAYIPAAKMLHELSIAIHQEKTKRSI